MSEFIVSARKYRPATFSSVVGQKHITSTLKNAIERGQLAHAYLFCGPRGVGKTTCARIFAKAINCLSPDGTEACNECESCRSFNEGRSLNIHELDAASNNSVEDIRTLIEQVRIIPQVGRYSVFIIDEVHMLSTAAFNALLKILEEPPEHLMFILATTELHKVPATIKSRCQQFAFKRISPADIAGRLQYVAGEERIPLTGEGANLLSRLADGGMRDALSLLDQCAGGGAAVDEQAILNTLGLAGNVETAALMGQLAARDTAAALNTLSRLYANGKDVGSVLGELSALARDLLLRKTAPQGGAALMAGGYDEATLRGLGEQLTAQRLLQMLTERQREFYDLYYNEDLSLAEIAENYGISRQGVRDVIVRAEAALTELEDKTKLIKRFHTMRAQLEQVHKDACRMVELTAQMDSAELETLAQRVRDAADTLLKE